MMKQIIKNVKIKLDEIDKEYCGKEQHPSDVVKMCLLAIEINERFKIKYKDLE